MAQTPLNPASEVLDTADMQGLVARAYGNLPFARYVLCRIADPAAARAWLGQVAGQIFTAERPSDDGPCLNLAFTWAGLARLGLPDDVLCTFPRALQEGMVTEHRSRVLGDFGASAPTQWRWGGPDAEDGPLHVVVMLFALTEVALDQTHAERRAAYQGALEEVGQPIEGGLLPVEGREHFGFADGLSQPRVKGWPARAQHSVRPPAPPVDGTFDEVEPGEIVLGYKDNFGKPAEGPTVPDTKAAGDLPKASWTHGRRDLGRNGSYLVFRQLAQNVVAFNDAVQAASDVTASRGDTRSPAWVAAKVVGRWASGAPLVRFPESDPGSAGGNDFGYAADDTGGQRCPLGAHVRRANPRDSSDDDPAATLNSTRNHRILRRGRPYGRPIAEPPGPGEAPDDDRGLLFLCLNTDIERQFEFVQHTWINNPFFAGLDGEIDPLVGAHPSPCGPFTVQDEPVRRHISGMSGFVSTRGGAYLFLPGVKALRYLSTISG